MADAPRPNVLFLFSDDQRFDTIRALGNHDIMTPNLDRLVARGVSFTHAHIMGGNQGAVCVPSRAMVLTGRTLFRAPTQLPAELTTWPEAMRGAGYTTFLTGKWHNDRQAVTRGFTCGGPIFFGGMSDHLKVPVHQFSPAGDYPKEKARVSDKFSSELFADALVNFITGYRDPRPFFAYCAFTAPHDPRMAPKEYADLYDPAKLALPPNFLPQHPFDNGELRVRDELLAPFPRTPEVIRRHVADYYAMITHMDAQIGRVMGALEETGQADNTLVIFAGDNGLAVGQHGLMGKQSVYEHSVRVPLVMAGPGIPTGQRTDSLCYLLDIFPTVCELTGVPTPPTVEGKSLAPVLRDPKASVRDSLFLAYRDFQRAVREPHYKLIEYHVQGKRITQLFDLQTDPWELTNLATDPGHGAEVTRLRQSLQTWRRELGDPSLANWPDLG